jgi:hypothetical protein
VINVVQVPPEIAGRNAEVVKRGADALGWHGDYIFRNVRGCVGSGVCTFGCPTSAKQHTGLTYVPQGWAAGATTFSETRARRIVMRGGRARGVEATTSGGGRVTVDCDTVVVACGAIHTPLFLHRQGLGRRSGELGNNLAIHPASGVRAVFAEEIDMARGVPQSFYIDEFADEGIMFEGAAGPPDYASMTLPFSGERHRDAMLRFPHVSQFGVMVSDVSRGNVRERAGRAEIRYSMNTDDVVTFKRGGHLHAGGGSGRAARRRYRHPARPRRPRPRPDTARIPPARHRARRRPTGPRRGGRGAQAARLRGGLRGGRQRRAELDRREPAADDHGPEHAARVHAAGQADAGRRA